MLAIATAEQRGVQVTGKLVADVTSLGLIQDRGTSYFADAAHVDVTKTFQDVLHELTQSGRHSLIGEGLWKAAFATPSWPEAGDQVRLPHEVVTAAGLTIPPGTLGQVVQPHDRVQSKLIWEQDKRPVVFDGYPGVTLIHMVLLEREKVPSKEVQRLTDQVWMNIGRDGVEISGILDQIVAQDLPYAGVMAQEMQNMHDSQMRDVTRSVQPGGVAQRAADDAEFIRDYLVSHGAAAPMSQPPPTAPEGSAPRKWWRRH